KRGVVACASYNARKFGVHAGMPNIQAVRLCPKLIFITPNFDKYMEVSDELRKVLFNFSPYVEMFSIDEAFLDVTGCARLWGTPLQMVSRVKSLVKSRTGLNCSVGIAPTKYLAKYAAGVNKPSGFFIIPPEKLRDILPQIPVKKISGVGPQFQKILKRLGVVKLGDVLKFPEEYWRSRLGKVGYWLYNIAKGKELEPVTPVTNAKSMGK
ncbi:DNA polymerase IV, partial [Candidatus Dependentiae bacterium]|nr:DNA polymerase IV [Candidatus Dependentiae bacterium]